MEDAVMDAVVDTALDTDTGAEPEVDTGAEPESTEGAEPEPGAPAIESPSKPLIDGGKLSAEAKETLDKIKLENPALAKALQRALFKEAEYSRELPGGLKDVKALRETIETLGGEHGIAEIQAEVNGWHQFDEQYMAGDPKAVEFMTSEPEGQEAFLKLIPSALQKYEELHPEGYSQYMAQVFSHTISNAGLPLALERLSDFIGDNPKAQEQWTKIAQFIKSISAMGSKQVEAPKFGTAQPDTRGQDIEAREAQLTRNEWRSETASAQRQVFESEWARLSAGRKLSDPQTAAIRELFESRLNRAVGQHKETLERYFKAKDKAGFLRYASQLNKTELPKALREAFDAVVPAKPGPKANNGTPPKPGGTPAKGAPIAQGFVQVAKQPATSEINYTDRRNTPQLFQSGKAFLKSGKAVQWSR